MFGSASAIALPLLVLSSGLCSFAGVDVPGWLAPVFTSDPFPKAWMAFSGRQNQGLRSAPTWNQDYRDEFSGGEIKLSAQTGRHWCWWRAGYRRRAFHGLSRGSGDTSSDPDRSPGPPEVATLVETGPTEIDSSPPRLHRRATAPRLISDGGTGGKRSRGVYCVQLALGGVQQSGGRLTDEGLHLQLLAIEPRQPPSRPAEGPIRSATAADGTAAVEMFGHRWLSNAVTLAFHFLGGLIPNSSPSRNASALSTLKSTRLVPAPVLVL